MSRTLADLLIERLRAWRIPRVFGYAGDGIDPVLAALRRTGGDPEFVQTRHEEMAAFMASGHAKYSGRPGVCLATQGPGAIHLLAGLYDAKLDRRPVVAIVGQVVSTALGSGYLQEVDLHALFKDVCGQYLQTAFTPEQVPMLLDNAMRTAISTNTPTCLIIPHDVQRAEAPEEIPHSHCDAVRPCREAGRSGPTGRGAGGRWRNANERPAGADHRGRPVAVLG
jgi:pyruvate dehydrogenase (quinone)